MRVILVVVIAVVWLVILAPGFLRRRSASGESDSISHFHQQLRVLEHSAPRPIVAPAYRLRGADDSLCADGDGSSRAPVLSVVGARDLPRPALAFLAEDPGVSVPEPAAPWAGAPDAQGERLAWSGAADPRRRTDGQTRRLTRQRRRDTLSVIVLALVLSLMIGFVPGASVAWVASGIFAAALCAYVTLLVHLRRVTEERERKLHYLRPPVPATGEGPDSGEAADAGSGLTRIFAAR